MDGRAIEILDTVQVGALATVNRDRTPLVTPLHFARYDEQYVMWISDRDSQHARNAYRTGAAEFVVWDEQKRAVFIKTAVMVLPEEQREAALAAYQRKLGDFMPRCQHPQIYIMPIGQLDENSTTGNWLHFVA